MRFEIVRYSLNGAEVRGIATSLAKAEEIKSRIDDGNSYITIEKKN